MHIFLKLYGTPACWARTCTHTALSNSLCCDLVVTLSELSNPAAGTPKNSVRRGLMGQREPLAEGAGGWDRAKLPFPEAEEMVGAWLRQMEQAVKWQKEMGRQSRSEGEPWCTAEARSQ